MDSVFDSEKEVRFIFLGDSWESEDESREVHMSSASDFTCIFRDDEEVVGVHFCYENSHQSAVYYDGISDFYIF